MSPSEPYLGLGSRLTSGPSAAMARVGFGGELEGAPVLHPYLYFADVAHVVALTDAGLVRLGDARLLIEGLRRLDARPAAEIAWDPSVGDVYNNREALLATDVGAIADHLATGRARREATTVAWLLACRDRLTTLGLAVAGLVEDIVSVAAANTATVMADFTYLHHAQPTTLGHYLLGFAFPLLRDGERIGAALARANLSPAGSGSVNGSRLPIDRELLARLLGFDGIRLHTRDAMWAPDVAMELCSTASSVAVTLDRLVEELQIWSSSEFAFVRLADAHCRTSVIMPQKRNPYSLTQVRGEARRLLGDALGVTLTQLTPTGQPDNRTTAYQAVPAMLDKLTASTALVGEVLTEAEFDSGRLEEMASVGHPYATDLCDHLTLSAGLANRQAHRVVGKAVAMAEARAGAVSAADLSNASAELGIDLGSTLPDVADELDPRRLIALRTTPGGAAPTSVTAMLDACTAGSETLRSTIAPYDPELFGASFERQVASQLDRLAAQEKRQ